MTDERCGTCKYWQTPEQSWGPSVRLRDGGYRWDDDENERRAQEIEQQYRECVRIDFGLDEPDAGAPLPLAYVIDGSDYKAEMWTRAEFGCAMWEAK